MPPIAPAAQAVLDDVRRALAEDLGGGDATAELLPAGARAQAHVITREDAVLCGAPWVDACFRSLDAEVEMTWHAADGDAVTANQRLFSVAGNARALVSAERCALNF